MICCLLLVPFDGARALSSCLWPFVVVPFPCSLGAGFVLLLAIFFTGFVGTSLRFRFPVVDAML